MIELLTQLTVPLILCGVALYACGRRVDVYAALVRGAATGLDTLVGIAPSLVTLLTVVYMLRASGAVELAAGLMAARDGTGGAACPAAAADAGAAHQRLGSPWSGGGTDEPLGAGFLCGAGGGSDAGLHGDHVLYHCGILRRRGGRPYPVHHPGRSVRGYGGLSGLRLGRAPAVRDMRDMNSALSLSKKPSRREFRHQQVAE